MSNKKQSYITKTVSTEAASTAPPRYQPPPQPPVGGILKHHPHHLLQPGQRPPLPQQHQQQHQQQQQQQNGISSSATTKDANKLVYPSTAIKTGPDPTIVKGPYPAPADQKFYPVPPQAGIKQYLGYHPSSYPLRDDIRAAQQPQRPIRPYEDDLRLNPSARSQEDHPPAARPEDFGRRPVQRYPSTGLDDDLLRGVPSVDMLKFVRKSDDNPRGGVVNTAESTRHMQGLLQDVRVLKEANQRLADDNQELRDLCCFLDDDRQKGRKLAREWQRFGRYTASVMRQEVSAYQSKLRELDNKQQELIKDNLELKELCLYLDEERTGGGVCPSCGSSTSGGQRDDGDGSSSSTNADEPGLQFNSNGVNAPPRRSASRERLLNENLARQRSTFNDQTMQYVRSLEQRVKQLEDEKRVLQHKINQLNPGGPDTTNLVVPSSDSSTPVLSGRPEAVVRALQVLEVREQLEREGVRTSERETRTTETILPEITAPDMDDGEKALVREMCNVVWRKLEEGPQPRR